MGRRHAAPRRPRTSRSATYVAWSRPATRRRTWTAAAGWWRRTPTGTAPSWAGRRRTRRWCPPRRPAWWPGSTRAGPGVQRLVVWDLPEQRKVAGVVVSGVRTEPTGFDGGWLTFRTGTTDCVWNPHGGEPIRTGDGAPRADGDRWASSGRHGGRHPARAGGADPPRGPQGLEPDDLPARRLRLAVRRRPAGDHASRRPTVSPGCTTRGPANASTPGTPAAGGSSTRRSSTTTGWPGSPTATTGTPSWSSAAHRGSRWTAPSPDDLGAAGTPVIARDSLG